jgi:acyl-CoA synthetase (AMP-forming)/AMP-acid ligase II
MGERVGAVVVPRPGTSVALDELRAFAAARLAAFKRPEALYVVADIPRNPTGKTDKRRLRDQLLQSSSGGTGVSRGNPPAPRPVPPEA